MRVWQATLVLASVAAGALFGCGDGTRSSDTGAPSRESMRAGVASALDEPDILLRSERLVGLLLRANEQNMQGAVEAFDERIIDADPQDLRLLIAGWYRVDPDSALIHAMKWPTLRLRQIAAAHLLHAWAAEGKTARALAAYDSMEPGVQQTALGALAAGWMMSGDVGGLTRFAKALPAAPTRDAVLLVIAATLRKDGGVDALKKWVNELPDEERGGFKRSAFHKALQSLSSHDPASAAAWLAAEAGSENAAGAMKELATRWADKDPVAAIAWLRTQPPGEEREAGVAAALHVWGLLNEPAASRWLLDQPPEPAFDRAFLRVVERSPEAASETARAFAERITDDALRARALEVFHRRWPDADSKPAPR